MCGDCRVELERRGILEQFRKLKKLDNDGFMLSQSVVDGGAILVHVHYKGKRMCERWWDETVVGVAGGEGAPFGFP